LTGGAPTAYVSPPTADGIVSNSEMEGMIFTTNALGGTYIYFRQAAATLNLTGLDDCKVYWLYYDWNGGTPQYAATATRTDVHEYDQFTIGRAWRSGNIVEIQSTGHNLYDKDRRAHNRLILKYGNMDRNSGAVISAHATALRLACTAGSWYCANHPFTTAEANTFHVWYKSGSATWVESSEITLFSDIFNGAAATVYESYQDGNDLGTITGNNYGCHWIFTCPEGEMYVLLGTASYPNIGSVQDCTIPTSLPPYLVNWGKFIGRVVCQEEGAAFYSVESVFSNVFMLSATVEHNSTGGLNVGDYKHLTAAEHGGLHTQNTDTALGAQTENLDMNTHKIVGVVDPATDQEAATKKYVDDNAANLDYVPIATSGDYTIPTAKSFIGGDEFSIDGTDTLSIEGTGRMILVG